MNALVTGRRIKCLTCVNDLSKECPTTTVAFAISGMQVTRILDSIALSQSYQNAIRADQGRSISAEHLTSGLMSMA